MRQSRSDDRLDGLSERVDLGFKHVDERFEHVDERFKQVDKRFDQVDRRFDQVDQRLARVETRMDGGFVELNARLDRFQQTIIVTGGAIVATLIATCVTALAT